MADLTTYYMGLKLRNPFVISSSPLTENTETIKQLEEKGAAAFVLPSLFEEQIQNESKALNQTLDQGTESFAESLSYFPDLDTYGIGPQPYLKYVEKVKSMVSVPVIASLNGLTQGGWIEYAEKIEAAGADALELNLYSIAANPLITATMLEDKYLSLVSRITQTVTIPVAVKVSPFFTSLANIAKRFEEVGTNALVFFNRFYQPDIDPEQLEVTHTLELSSSHELNVRLRWVALLFHQRAVDFAVTGGVHTVKDVVKTMMAGARAVMITSVLLQRGIEHLSVLIDELAQWLLHHEYPSIRALQGVLSQKSVKDFPSYERANYMKVLGEYT